MYALDTAAYFDTHKKEQLVEELFFNAFRTIKSVYVFEHFEEYVRQLNSNRNEDKKDEYWKVSYDEKLIDHVKICISFENYNKATLLEKGVLVHKIKKSKLTQPYADIQRKGIPVPATDVLAAFGTTTDEDNYIYLNGLTSHFQTINYTDTLNDEYQKFIGLDNELIVYLKKINDVRNRLHLFLDFRGAFSVNSHIKMWRFVKDKSLELLELPLKLRNDINRSSNKN